MKIKIWKYEFEVRKKRGESNIFNHAQRELEISEAGDTIYGDLLPEAVLELVDTFVRQGHSGMSAGIVVDIFSKVVMFKNLSPITDSPDDWIDVSDFFNEPMWQCKRASKYFSTDGGKSYYDVDDKNTIFESLPAAEDAITR